jgi:hypothetical protein
MKRIYIQEAVLKGNEVVLPYIKEKMIEELKRRIDELNWEDIISIERRAKCNVFTIDVEFK